MIAAIDQTLTEFGRSMGMESLVLRDDGSLVLEIDRIGTLAFELIGEYREDVSVSLTNYIEPPDETACRRILDLSHPRDGAPWPVHGGLNSRGALVFAIGMSSADFTLPNIHLAVDWLDGLHQQMSAVARSA